MNAVLPWEEPRGTRGQECGHRSPRVCGAGIGVVWLGMDESAEHDNELKPFGKDVFRMTWGRCLRFIREEVFHNNCFKYWARYHNICC